MKPHYATLLVFTACVVIVTGCRRGGTEPRKPLANNERDVIAGRREKDVAFAARPKERREKIWVVNVKEVEAELKNQPKEAHKKRWQAVGTMQKEIEKAKDGNDQSGKLKDAAEKAQQEDESFAFAKQIVDYLKKNPSRMYSEELLSRHLRTEDAYYERKYLDTIDHELVTEYVPYTRFLEERRMTFVPFVDMKAGPGQPKFVVCYTSSNSMGGGQSTTAVWHDLTFGTATALPEVVAGQELRIVQAHFFAYRGTLVRDEPTNYDKFKQYLYANAPPPLLADIDVQEIYLPKWADGTLGGLLACRTEMKYTTPKDQYEEKKALGHMCIDMVGAPNFRFPPFAMPKSIKKSSGTGGMGPLN